MDQRILQILEEEVEKRVNERLAQVIEKISQTYDISLRQLMRDVAVIEDQPSTVCRGLTAKGKQCRHIAKKDGYCYQHVRQKPVQHVTVRQSSQPTVLQHTHTLPPLYLAGCPACEKNRTVMCV